MPLNYSHVGISRTKTAKHKYEEVKLLAEERTIQQSADEFVTALVNTIGSGTVQEVVDKNRDDALDISNIAVNLPLKEMPPEVVKYLKDLVQTVKGTSMDTRHDLNLAFPPSHFSGEDNPLMLFYKAFYDTVTYYTTLIQSVPEVRDALIKAMADKGYNEDNIDEFLKREWDINAYLMNLPQIAEIFKELPDHSDYNHGKPNNYSLQNAKRKIEHMSGGQLVEKVSIERGGPKDASGQYTPYPLDDATDVTSEVIDKVYLEQCLALLSPEDRELLVRHANGETYTALAKDYGYANASGVRKRIERIKKQITEKFIA